MTQVGAFGGAFQEIAIDETSGQMVGTNLDRNRLYAINKADATRTEIAAFSAQGSGNPGAFADLTFTLEGQLYGMTTTAIYEIVKATAEYNPSVFPDRRLAWQSRHHRRPLRGRSGATHSRPRGGGDGCGILGPGPQEGKPLTKDSLNLEN